MDENERDGNNDRQADGGNFQVTDKRRFLRLAQGEEAASGAGEVGQSAQPQRFPTYVEELQAKLQASENQLREYASRVREAQASFQAETERIRERLNRNFEQRLEAAKAELVERLLEALDNLERAIKVAESGSSFESLLDGVKATQAIFLRQLGAAGVSVIISDGQPFDPAFHEAVEVVEVDPELEGKVIETHQPGYLLGQRLIRPAKVRVGRSRTANMADSQQQNPA